MAAWISSPSPPFSFCPMRSVRFSRDGLIAMLVVALFSLPACIIVVDADDDDDLFRFDDLEDTTWVLEAIVIDDRSYPVRDGIYSLEFERRGFGGTADCNVYGGDYHTSRDGGLSIDGLYSTEVACEPPSFENEYFRNLENVAFYRIRSGDLYLYDRRDDLLLRFEED